METRKTGAHSLRSQVTAKVSKRKETSVKLKRGPGRPPLSKNIHKTGQKVIKGSVQSQRVVRGGVPVKTFTAAAKKPQDTKKKKALVLTSLKNPRLKGTNKVSSNLSIFIYYYIVNLVTHNQ